MKKNPSSKPKFCLILINSSSLNLINLKIMKIPPIEPVYLRKLKTLDGRFSCIILLNNQCQSKVFLRGLKYNYLPHTVNLLWDGKSTRTFKGWLIALAGTWTPVFTGTAHGRHPANICSMMNIYSVRQLSHTASLEVNYPHTSGPTTSVIKEQVALQGKKAMSEDSGLSPNPAT